MTFDGESVFNGNGNSEQRTACAAVTLSNQFVGGISLSKRVRRVVADERVNFSVHARNLVETGLRGFARGNFAPGEFRGEFGNGQLI